MGDFSKHNTITRINEILSYIDSFQDTINLNNNVIKKASLDVLPYNIVNVYLDDNLVSQVIWDDRPWKTISLKNNNMDVGEFDGLNCDKLILDNNDIKEITFVDCKINYLSITNNKITNINFFDCCIERLDLSVNKIQKIITLPSDLKILKLDSNKIREILISLSDTIVHLDLSDNKLENIKDLPSFVTHLDLSKNNLKSINTLLLSDTLQYFDITENKIANNTELFEKFQNKILKIYYDLDNENEDYTKISDEISATSEMSEVSDISDLSSVKLNYVNMHLLNNYNELKIDFDNNSDSNLNNAQDNFDDEEINKAIAEYKNGIKEIEIENENENENQNENEKEVKVIEDASMDKQNKLDFSTIDEQEYSNEFDNILNQRDLMIKAAIQRFRSNNTNQNITIKEKVLMPLENVELKWNINL